uniref:Iron-sulfur cluster biosynthesis transcriptional regulator SufR n=1 Tax=Desertifilum tharense IPPAS B-1220 TaxID=1781255 RepID=A0ACD5GS11_9CYAN
MATTQHPSTKQDILQHLLQQGQATAQELAEVLRISPQAIRRHLKDLEEEELIEYQAIQGGHGGTEPLMGRPKHVYHLSRKGRHQFPDNHAQFAVSLLDTLQETVGSEQVSSILRKQWQRKAQEYRDRLASGTLQERVVKLVELRRAEGYMAQWYPLDENDDGCDRFMMTENNCAISDVAESFPSVCGHELEMFASLLPDCKVERTTWIVGGEHRCGYLIQPKNSLS